MCQASNLDLEDYSPVHYRIRAGPILNSSFSGRYPITEYGSMVTSTHIDLMTDSLAEGKLEEGR